MDTHFTPKEYWEKRLRDTEGIAGVGYLGMGQGYNRWLYKVRRQIFLRQVKSLGLSYDNIHVLDIGSGTGFYVEIWKSLGVRAVTGSDITSIAIERLMKHFPEFEFYQLDIGGSLEQQQFAGRKYDVISAFDVLFHIVDDNQYQKAITNISEMLRPGGLSLFSENFLHRNTIRLQHQVSRPLSEIEDFLKGAHLEIVRRIPMFFIMNYPADSTNIVFKQLWNLMMIPVRKSEVIGFVIGGLLYPLELLLTALVHESPSTEMMVCKKLTD
ncbi:MAG: class I SAM-dependent methyltransferase [Planctomycetota bacterium]|nr:class I SAM-dependent methyltransferase [Planctomycetota bacterium]